MKVYARPVSVALVCLLAVGPVSVRSARAAQYVVAQQDPAASDGNPGTPEAPWKTLSRAVRAVGPGDVVTIRAGLYRDALGLHVSGTLDAPITFRAARGQDGGYEPVTVSGADLFTQWEKDGDAWRYTGGAYGLNAQTYADDFTFRREQAMCDGEQLRHVPERKDMTPGTFWIDDAAQALYVRLPGDAAPAEHAVEASTRYPLVGVHGEPLPTDIRLFGLVFRYSCNRAQWGAVLVGTRWVVEDCDIGWTVGCGLGVWGDNYVLRRVKSHHHAQLGMGGNGANGLIEECEFSDNNWKGFSADWECGGFKLCGTRGVKLLRCTASRNAGDGMWFDIDNFAGEVRQCRLQDNARYGLFIEISGDFVVADNLCTGNKSAGVCVGESRDCYVAFNTCVGNGDGVTLRGHRVPRGYGGTRHVFWDANVTVRNNLFAFNTEAGFSLTWAEAEAGDERPGRMDLGPGGIGLLLDHNYYVCPQAHLARFDLPARRNQSRVFDDLAALREAHGFEKEGRAGTVQFVDRGAGDYRLAPASAAIATEVYIMEGDTPDGKVSEFQPGPDQHRARPAGMRYPAVGMASVIQTP